MSGVLFWVFMAGLFVLLWWAGFYATKDMRVRKNAMREEEAKRNLERLSEQQTAEKQAVQQTAAETEKTTPAEDKTPKDTH